jgi:hypothetical protein
VSRLERRGRGRPEIPPVSARLHASGAIWGPGWLPHGGANRPTPAQSRARRSRGGIPEFQIFRFLGARRRNSENTSGHIGTITEAIPERIHFVSDISGWGSSHDASLALVCMLVMWTGSPCAACSTVQFLLWVCRDTSAITTFTALTALWAVTRLQEPLGVHLNYQLSWITSVGKLTVRDFISYPPRLECEFARDSYCSLGQSTLPLSAASE